MTLAFHETFPGLKLDDALYDIFLPVVVEKVSATRQKDFIRIYVKADQRLDKVDISCMEEEIEGQLFSGQGIKVQIMDGGDEEDVLIRDRIEEIARSAKQEVKAPPDKTVDLDLIHGREFDGGSITALSDIEQEMGRVVVRGKIISCALRSIKNEKTIISFSITDFSDSIKLKIFAADSQAGELAEALKLGTYIKVKGTVTVDKYDNELTIGHIMGIKKTADFSSTRTDEADIKRVELHCHTKMSEMDGVSDVGAFIERAYKWGHEAIAITDHGVVLAFPEAYQAWNKIYETEKKRLLAQGDKESAVDSGFFKIIYGLEAYLVDDMSKAAIGFGDQKLNGTAVVFDLETTGLSPQKNRIIEIGAVKVKDGELGERFHSFVNPGVSIPLEIEKLTGISDAQLKTAPDISVVLTDFLAFVDDAPLIAHNAAFDLAFLTENMRSLGKEAHFATLDTLSLSRLLMPEQRRHTLGAICKSLYIRQKKQHRADDDAESTALVFIEFCRMLAQKGISDFAQIADLDTSGPEMVKKLPRFHVVILAANEVGLKNLYTLVSESHIKYFARRPRIPKSLLSKHREGLIIGSACEAGELYRAHIEGKSEADIMDIAQFYDYLEIQPDANNQFMLESARVSAVSSLEDIHEINRRIVQLGEKLNKPVIAASDAHFVDPEDEIYRRIILAGRGFDETDTQTPLYLRTTQEMLDEFEYLGKECAWDVVVKNTRLVANMIESISPLRAGRFPPIIPGSEEELKEMCYRRATHLYGEPLPAVVAERLERELNSIIGNGFATMYVLAAKLVAKSLEDGYLVGSRGSVGSSFVATMAGITEVNPLCPHYYCPTCRHSDFDSEIVKEYGGRAGFDLPDKVCPGCAGMLKKDGFDIPFETFLGFEGDKEPDIDLNFSGEYQAQAHKYTEDLLGAGQTFRAGTISTLADKTAYGYVKKYFDGRSVDKRRAEIDRLVAGLTGIRKSTGQHPGGIILLPLGEDINAFTPVQWPANDENSRVVTTHFDYHSIEHNLLKLDILGHDDPTMIRKLQDLTGEDPLAIPFQDEKVMSLFKNTEALGVAPGDIGCRLGAMGVPEFGTEFVIQMLEDAGPDSFFDLICISGLSHGTDVWLGNAERLIKEGKANISTVISTRDDIMTYLIGKGLDSSLSFNIMESVRRGRGLKPEWEKAMKAARVPDWYINSCVKIKYMFPKAHAAAYVMMAWRIAYFKVYHPQAYYAAFFSIRASAFDYEIMCQGPAHLRQKVADYKQREETGELSPKEQNTLRDMKIVTEMYARGFEFLPLDIYKAQAHDFQIIEGKIMPPFSSIEGLGEKAAEQMAVVSQRGEYLSIEDFQQRTKVNKTVLSLMERLNLLSNLPKSNQMSLFDYM